MKDTMVTDKATATEKWNQAKKDLKTGEIDYSKYLLIKNACKPEVCIHFGKKGNSYDKQKKKS